MKRIISIFSSVLLFISLAQAQVKSMYGDRVKADVKMNYVFSFEEALKKAKKEKKLIFFNCFADWAVPCHGMNKFVFSNQEFADWMDKHFVNFFIDVTTAEGRPLAQKYNIKIQAHYLVLDSDGNIVHRIVGGHKLPEFKDMLTMALNPKTSLVGMDKRYEDGERNSKFLRSYAAVLRVADKKELYRKVADEYFACIKPDDWAKKENWVLFNDRVREPKGEMFEHLMNRKDLFVKNNGEETINNKISSLYFMPVFEMAKGDYYDGAKLLDIYMALQKADLPKEQMIYTVYDIAKYRGERNFDKMMDIFEEKVPELDDFITMGLDMSLDEYKDLSVDEMTRVVDYLNKRADQMKGSAQSKYRSIVKSMINPEGIQFLNLTFDEALKQAKTENKLVFVDCYTSWCGPCKTMSEKVFTQKYIGDFFNKRFVNIKINMEQGEGPQLQNKLNVDAFPTMLILDGDGKVVYKILGGCDARGFMEKINRGILSEYNYHSLKEKYAAGERSLEIMPYYLITMIDAGELDNQEGRIRNYLNLLKNEDKYNKTTWVLYDYFIKNYKMPEFEFVCANRKEFAAKLGEEQVNKKIERIIFPAVIGYLNHEIAKEDMKKIRQMVTKADLPEHFSLTYLIKIIGLYDKKEFGKIMDFYENTVPTITDRLTRLNLDVILDSVLQNASSDVKRRAIDYVKKSAENADSKSLDSYRKLLEDLTVAVK